MNVDASLNVVVMAKRPALGRVKTRLCDDGHIDQATALEIAWSMLCCTIDRLSSRGPITLAITPEDSADDFVSELANREIHLKGPVLHQGSGDLGARLDHVWRQVGLERRLCFFGTDSPDVPFSIVDQVQESLRDHDITIGPTFDGGYWVLAASCYCPEVLKRIDWGSNRVYDQSCQRASEAGLKLSSLPEWHDVDYSKDVEALYQRLDRTLNEESTDSVDSQALQRLYDRLTELCYAETS